MGIKAWVKAGETIRGFGAFDLTTAGRVLEKNPSLATQPVGQEGWN